MSRFVSRHRRSLRALAAFAVSAAASASCTLDLSGLGAGGASTSTSTSSSTSSAGGMTTFCTADVETQPCYSGSADTQGKGTCKAGTMTCKPDGSGFGECVGEVVPAKDGKDDCEQNLDTNCDGQLVCPCTAGMTMPCYDGASGTKDVGLCKGGVRTCQASGMSYGACEGQVTPKPEDCATPDDEDCDGHAFDDTNSGCVCKPSSVADCMTSITGCKPGKQTCLVTGKGYDTCVPTPNANFDDCFTAADEDCNGTTAACVGSSLLAASAGMTGQNDIFGAATDKAGNLFFGGVSGSSEAGAYTVVSGVAWIAKLDPSGTPLWAQGYPATGNKSYSVIRGLTVDGSGNVIAIGEYNGFIAAGGVLTTSFAGSVDAFVLKLDPNGNMIWSRSLGTTGDQLGVSAAVATNGDVLITGRMDGMADFGTGLLTAKGTDVFVARLDGNSGAPKWGKLFGDGKSQSGWGIAATPDSAVVVAGQFNGDIDFGGGKLTNAGANSSDIFLAKLDGNGAQVWAKRFGDDADQVAFGLAADSNGNLVITGSLHGSTDFGSGSLTVPNGKPEDVFVARFGPDGAPLWSKSFGDTDNLQISRSVAVDRAGNVLFTGYFKGSLKLDNSTTLVDKAPASSAATDIFVAKLKGSDGSFGWARSFGDMDDQGAWVVTTDPLGDAILGGTYKGTIDFGPPAGLSFTSASNYDVFWAKLAP